MTPAAESAVPWLAQHGTAALMVVFRLSGLAIFGPVLGSPAVPWKVRAYVVLALGACCYPALAGAIVVDAPASPWGYAALAAGELTTGMVVGLLATLPMVAMQLGGLLSSQQLGLGFGRFYLPSMDDEGDAIEQMLFLLALVSFLAIGGLEQMVLAVLGSYDAIPPGGFPAAGDAVHALTGLLGGAFELALRVGAPILAIVTVESVAMGFVGRTVPSVNVLSIGFPLRILLGLALLATGIGVIHAAMHGFMDEAILSLRAWMPGGPAGA
ncbi:MAG: flagellar biosynthetic protein FliR [Phycisphaerales bacterium]